MTFGKDSKGYKMMAAYYPLMKKYGEFPQNAPEALWTELIREMDQFVKEFNEPNDHLAVALAGIIIDRAEDQSMGRAVLCQVGNDSAVKAVMEYYGNGGNNGKAQEEVNGNA